MLWMPASRAKLFANTTAMMKKANAGCVAIDTAVRRIGLIGFRKRNALLLENRKIRFDRFRMMKV